MSYLILIIGSAVGEVSESATGRAVHLGDIVVDEWYQRRNCIKCPARQLQHILDVNFFLKWWTRFEEFIIQHILEINFLKNKYFAKDAWDLNNS